DTINQQIYVSLADTLDLKHINWSLDLDSNVIIFPYDQSLYDFSKDFSFMLVDTLEKDSSKWTFRIKISSTSLIRNTGQIKQIVVYPNPVNTQLNFEGIKYSEIIKAEIYSTQGQLIQSLNKFPCNVANLKSGEYIVKIYLFNNQCINTIFVKMP
ncbi:MAG: T9SS type A sorting domain-containing protein, partial [Bacteroidales bacterium]|nr:T9SS type A sorting domain-containing protein [Bacteroidales bacterium]